MPIPVSRSATRRLRRLLVGLTVAAVPLGGPSLAAACSQDDATWLESFVDQTCLEAPLTNVTLDAAGGLRLDTNGAASSLAWDTDAHFATGVVHDGVPFGRVGVSTLATSGTGTGATLTLPSTLLPLSPAATPVVGPTPSAVPDGDHVDGPSVIRTATGYVMYYVGLGEDGTGPAIYRATSTDGKAWTRAASPNTAVLAPTPGAFDEKGVSGPHVIHDPADVAAPYRMYYAGQGEVFGAIGYATSTDGVAWVKHTGTANPADPPVPVLAHGQGGSADSFAAADPWVIKDGVVWKMWYTADDSNQKRIAYATSVDGIAWQKGGAVVTPGSPAIMKDDAFAPTVWKDAGGGFRMMFGGYNASGDQTKLVNATSADGIAWSGFGTGLPSSGSTTKFDASNLNSPAVLDEGAGAVSERFKLYYSGNTLDANGNAHYRIGLATGSNGSSFAKFDPGGNASVLDIDDLGEAFDARGASGLSVARTGGTGTDAYVGFYSGTRGSDFTPRLGVATSSDGESWTKAPVVTTGGNGGALVDLSPPGPDTAQDDDGQLDPAVLLDGTTYNLYYTGLDGGGVRRIFRIATAQDAGSKQPVHASWTAPTAAALAGDGTGFDADGVSHPSAVKDGSDTVVYYTGHSGSAPAIGRAQSASADLAGATRAASAVIAAGSAGTFDAGGAKDPVALRVGAGDYRMLYTAVDGDGVERLAYATSSDGVTWTKQGVVMNPSRTGFAFDEVGVGASGMLLDDAASPTTLQVYTAGRDRTGRVRGGYAESAYPTPGAPTSGIPMGWATYQVGDGTTQPRDWRTITRTSSGTGVELWLSFLQPYTIAGQPAWSDFFPVTELSAAESLNLLLTVRGVRWQARLSGPSGSPAVDAVSIDHAPVQFPATGSVRTTPVAPAASLALTAWGNLTVDTQTFSPGGGGVVGGTVSVRDADTDVEVVPPVALNTTGQTVQSLAAVDAAQHRRLRLVVSLSSDGTATPRVGSAAVSYTAVPLTGPLALFTVAPATGPAPLAVVLDGGASLVPVGRTITAYNWDLDGNGTVDRTTAVPTTNHTFLGGTHTPKLTITDSTGATSAAASQTVTATDGTAPAGVAVTGPSTIGKPFQVLGPLALRFSATDPESLITSYALITREATVGGAFGTPVTHPASPLATRSFTMRAGSTHCFRVRATNNVGLSTTSAERCTARPLHAWGLVARGAWAKKTKAGHYLNRFRTSKARGATLSRSGVTVKRLSLVATRGRGMGSVTVWLGTTKLRTVNLASSTTRRRQVIPIANFSRVRKGTIRIVVASAGKPVVIEGLAVSKV